MNWTNIFTLLCFVSHLQSEVDKSIHLRVAALEFNELVDAKDLT